MMTYKKAIIFIKNKTRNKKKKKNKKNNFEQSGREIKKSSPEVTMDWESGGPLVLLFPNPPQSQ